MNGQMKEHFILSFFVVFFYIVCVRYHLLLLLKKQKQKPILFLSTLHVSYIFSCTIFFLLIEEYRNILNKDNSFSSCHFSFFIC